MALSVEEGSAESFWAPLLQDVVVYDMNKVDDGTIDLLVLTCNGSEMNVLSRMRSRPVRMVTRYYCHNERHWEYYNRIGAWMAMNGYTHRVRESNQHGTFFHVEWTRGVASA